MATAQLPLVKVEIVERISGKLVDVVQVDNAKAFCEQYNDLITARTARPLTKGVRPVPSVAPGL